MPKQLLNKVMTGKISPEDFEHEMIILSKGNKRSGWVFNGTYKAPVRLYRSRVFESRKLPTNINEYSYPPAKICPIGRANDEYVPIFYASAGTPLTFVESKCEIGNIVVTSEFRCYCDLYLQKIGFEDIQLEGNDFEQMLHMIFTNPGNKYYKYSSKIAKHLLNGPQLHGILYPSIISNNQNQNLALKTEFVDNHLFLINCTAYEITGMKDQFNYNVVEFDFGINENDSILWKGRKKQWILNKPGAMLDMKSNGWQWDAFDENNSLIDPI